MLDDGEYEALVVDASASGDGSIALDLTLISGANKGDVVTVHARGLPHDAIDLLGLPATLTVHQGSPSVHLDDL